MKIQGRKVGQDNRCFILAEIGHNHCGSLEIAEKMVRVAAKAGVDAVKFQKRDNKRLYTKAFYSIPYNSEQAYGRTYGEHREALELSRDDYRRLQELADDLGIILFATAFDEPSVDFCMDLGMPAIKLASGDLTNTPLIKYAASADMPLILSTGGGALEDVDEAVKTVAGVIPDSQLYDYLAILQCTAIYPCPPEYLSLGVIQAYRRRYPGFTIGASIHDNGIAMSALAYGLGARIIEKHITLDRTMKGTDHSFSLEPQGLQKLVRDIRRAETAMGESKYTHSEEAAAILKMSKAIYYKRALASGHIVGYDDLICKSPGGGLPPSQLSQCVGKTLKQAVSAEEKVELGDLSDISKQAILATHTI